MRAQVEIEYLMMISLVLIFAAIAALVIIDTRNLSASIEEKIIQARKESFNLIG
jgi:uncharacterized protein (UPF0333 family)